MSHYFQSRKDEVFFIAITLLGFIAFYVETDIYTPSFPEMMIYFNTTEESIQKILSMNFLGLCLASLFFGPASDAYGRKPILCIGLFIFMIGSIGCAMTDSLEWMIALRFVQGIGCGAIVSAGLATFFDVFPPEKSARLVSILNGTVGGLMALAPIIGNWITIHQGWRTNFYLIAFLAILVFTSNLVFIKETLPILKRAPFNVHNVIKNYTSLLTNAYFMGYTMIWCLIFSMVILYIANLSLIFVDHLFVSQKIFGYYQFVIMGAFFVGSMTCAYFIKKLGMPATKYIGSVLCIVGILALGLFSYFEQTPIRLISAMGLVSLGCGLALTLFFADSMITVSEHLKGSAMAFTQFMRLSISSGLIWLSGQAFDGTAKPIAWIGILSLGFCMIIYFQLQRSRMLVVDVYNQK
ncbi:MAG: multidrug effflux MFS transporter [Gammaproteobacteria bacterium]